MEHRLIQGGEQYLPFARSLVAKLKKLGIPYANQSLDVGGVSIKVRIEPGNEHIRIDGGDVVVKMDSGIVDMGQVYTTPYDDGVLHETTSNTLYDVAFTVGREILNKLTGLYETWKLNPSKRSADQLSGDIYWGSKFKGRVPPDARISGSFSAEMTQVVSDPPVTPQEYARNEADGLLAAKKVIVMNCPASVFTGKCRLYVQAMYGRHLYDYSDITAGKPKAIEFPAYNDHTSVFVKAYKKLATSTTYPDVLISTSSGVFLDTETGKHWLICFLGSGGGLVFYPLVGKNEKMRYLLKKPKPGDSPKSDPLAAIDLDHLEAYILSTCLPDVANKQTLDVSDLPHAYSMGYGWHWDWTGGNADIVNIGAKIHNEGVGWTDVIQGEYYSQTSKHTRLTVTPTNITGDGITTTTWAAVLSVVMPLIEWSMYRNNWCLLEPNWSEGGFIKTTLPYQALKGVIVPASNVPLYAFYVRDELHVARVSIATSYPSDEVITQTYGMNYFNYSVNKDSYDYSTLGQHGGQYQYLGSESNVDGGRMIAVTFSCLGYQTTPLYYNKNKLGFECVISDKTMTGGTDTGSLETLLAQATYIQGDIREYYGLGYYASYGYPTNATFSTNPTHQTTWGGHTTAQASGNYVEMTYSATNSYVQEYELGYLIMVVPKGDAEAVYVKAWGANTRIESGVTRRELLGYNYAKWSQFVPMSPQDVWTWTKDFGSMIIAYKWSSPYFAIDSIVSTTNEPDVTTVTPSLDDGKLLGHAYVDAYFPDISEAHDDLVDWINSVTFQAYSGTSQDGPVLGPGRTTPFGYSGPYTIPAIVGWV